MSAKRAPRSADTSASTIASGRTRALTGARPINAYFGGIATLARAA